MTLQFSKAQSQTRLRRLATGGAAAALAVSGFAVAAPATAATSAPLDYTCTVPLLPAQAMEAVFSAPATVPVGGSVALSTTVKVPAALSELLYGTAGARTVSGTATGEGTANGLPITVTQTVPVTQVPASGDATVVANGTVPLPASVRVGTVLELGAGDFTVNLEGKKADGSASLLSPYAISCALDEGQVPAIGKVTVVKAGSTTKAKAKGAKAKATVKVTVKSETTVKATGKVKITVKQGKKKVTKNVKINKAGKAKVTVKKLKKGKATITVAYAGDKNVLASKSKKTTVKVK